MWRQTLCDKRDNNNVCKEVSDELYLPLIVPFLLKTREKPMLRENHDKTRTLQPCNVLH